MAKTVNKFLRLSPDLAEKIGAQSEKNARSFQGEITYRLMQSFSSECFISDDIANQLRERIDNVVNAMVADSWKGNTPPEDHNAIGKDVVDSVRELNTLINSLIRKG